MSYPRVAPVSTHITTVDCHKQVRSWRLLRAIMEFLIPTCNCTYVQEGEEYNHGITSKKSIPNKTHPRPAAQHHNKFFHSNSINAITTSTTIITGTIFGNRHGKVKLCIQTDPKSSTPILLLELAVSTSLLAKEMQGGLLRIALECATSTTTTTGLGGSLLSVPVWTMYCNGKKVGFAVRRKPLKADMEVLKKIGTMVVGAGVVNGEEIGCGEDDVMYLRGNFDRVFGSSDAESYHLIDSNDGSVNQDLSIFFLRSR